MDQLGEYVVAFERARPVTITFGSAEEVPVPMPRNVSIRIGRKGYTFMADSRTIGRVVDDDGTHVTVQLSPVGPITRTSLPNRSKGWRRHVRRTKQSKA